MTPSISPCPVLKASPRGEVDGEGCVCGGGGGVILHVAKIRKQRPPEDKRFAQSYSNMDVPGGDFSA